MSDESFRRRLEALNRGPLPPTIWCNSAPVPASARQTLERPTTVASNIMQPIPGLLRRGEVVKTSAGEHLRVRLPLRELWAGGERLVTARQQHLRQALAAAQQAVEPTVVMRAEFAALVAALPDRAIMLDLETCGLAGAALFLIGLLRQIDGAPHVELLVARDYAEEPAVLASLWQMIAAHDVLVTFNGKTFDWPMVLERSARYRFDPAASGHPLAHLDVLHHARRRWRTQLPDCRLLTLERAVCRRRRAGDVPGHRIPAIYADYVRTRFERDMDAVLYHNAVDLVTLLDLTLRLAG